LIDENQVSGKYQLPPPDPNRVFVLLRTTQVLKEFLHKKTEAQATSTEIQTRRWRSISEGGNDVENRRGDGHNERLHLRLRLHVHEHKQQHEERRLQVALLSLCAAIRGKWISGSAPEFATVIALIPHAHSAEEVKMKEDIVDSLY
jgi:hypothetical protein